MPANGNSNGQYDFTDRFRAPVLYYRLRIITAPGSIAYSNIISFRDGEVFESDARLMQNPVPGNYIPLQVRSAADKLQLLVTDMWGKKILQQTFFINAGVSQLNIPLPANTANGNYTLQVQGTYFKKSLRLVVLR